MSNDDFSKINITSGNNDIEILSPSEEKNRVFLSSTDPLNNEVNLWYNTWFYHILGKDNSHEDRHYLEQTENIKNIKRLISNPSYILSDKKHYDRIIYIGIARIAFLEKQDRIKPLTAVAEPSENKENSLEICTVMVQGRISEEINEGRRILYDGTKS
ncbi:hypothetical protein [Tetragenococcus muriaticus]|uniref:hypothetical protein n=1 Tax=Tetragenococcus muriaticus TaxID=64642 RepID=UPI000570738D|nr:hypothetical protein [Tetragenococcus muriaticus]